MDNITTFLHLKRAFFNRALRILLITNALILIASYMLGPIYAIFIEDIGGNLLDASFAGATFALSAGITSLLSGRMSDKVNRPELVVVFGYILIGIGYILYIFVNSIWFLLVCQVVIGLGEAIYSPAFDRVYSGHLTENKIGREWAAWESMNYFSAAVGALIGGLIAVNFGFDTLFTIMASLCLLSALYIYKLPKTVLQSKGI